MYLTCPPFISLSFPLCPQATSSWSARLFSVPGKRLPVVAWRLSATVTSVSSLSLWRVTSSVQLIFVLIHLCTNTCFLLLGFSFRKESVCCSIRSWSEMITLTHSQKSEAEHLKWCEALSFETLAIYERHIRDAEDFMLSALSFAAEVSTVRPFSLLKYPLQHY